MEELERTVWETLLGGCTGSTITVQSKRSKGAVTLVLDLAIVFQLCGLGRRISIFPRKILRVLCGYFEHQRRVQFDRCVAEPLQTITAILLGSEWSCLHLRIVLRDALSEVMQVPPLRLKVVVDEITAFMEEQNKEGQVLRK